MRKPLALMLAGLMAVSMVGCGSNGDAASSSDNKDKADSGKVTLKVTTTYAGEDTNAGNYKDAIDNRVTALQEKQQAEAEQEKIKVQKETEKIQAETDAQIQITKAQAEAESNKIISASITDELIRMKEAEARNKFGWVTVQGADTVVTNGK